ncbi:MAG TPA: MmcQ/YjbR family DNA-binding protein [Allosphingosinicella sp.]|nr:MmcQ/YjbR family DNA-binding protein [Allosphingosinicella sp.]
MPSADAFRRIALALPGAEEGAHMGHADFRVGGRIFATLGYPDASFGMVNLLPEQREDFMTLAPEAFGPAAGAWGRSGSTLVRLDKVPHDVLETALAAAWRKRAPRRLLDPPG